MKKQTIQSFFGYFVAALMIPLSFITLMGMGPISEMLVKVTGVEISPWYTGGEIVTTIDHAGYQTRIHRPVFDAFIGQRREGFVQIVWAPAESLPAVVQDEIDYNADGRTDFSIHMVPQTKTATWQSLNPAVVGLDGPYQIDDGIGVRVKLIRISE